MAASNDNRVFGRSIVSLPLALPYFICYTLSKNFAKIFGESAYIRVSAVKATVVDDRHIEYQGETTSVSALAQKLKGFTHRVQGTLWFTYQGERLTDLRNRLEALRK